MSVSVSHTPNENQHRPPSSVPKCIAEMRYCGVWKRENNTKVPYNPTTGQRAKSNDPSTFGTGTQVDRALATGDYDGRCYLVHESLGVTAGDLDHVIPETDAFNEAALPPDVRRVIRIANSYTTWSPSGTGIRFFFGATAPTYKNTNKSSPFRRVCNAEAYSHVRFMTDTGIRIAGTPDTFNDDPGDLDAWYEALGFEKREAEQPPRPQPTYAGGQHTNAEIIETANRVSGEKFRQLWAGSIAGYPESQTDKGRSSEADAALASILCGYTDDDDQVANMWRTSGLNRKKLDRQDYVDDTINFARRKQTWWFDWDRRSSRTAPAEPVAAAGSTPPTETQNAAVGSCNDVRAELAAARETIKQLHRDKSMLMALLLNPYVTSAEKTAVAATLDKSIRKRPGEDGFVVLKPGEIANDWRPRAKPGENTDPLNRDGSKPWMSRSAVKRTMSDLTERKFIEAKPDKRPVEPKGREPYTETVWLVKPPTSAADFLAPIALFQPADVTTRKPRTITPQCADCGVDLISVTTWTVTEGTCPECGQVHTEASKPRTVTPIVSIDPDVCAGGHVDKRSTVKSVGTSTVDKRSTCPAPPLDEQPPDYWIPPDDQYRYRPGTGEGAGHDRWTA